MLKNLVDVIRECCAPLQMDDVIVLNLYEEDHLYSEILGRKTSMTKCFARTSLNDERAITM